MIDCVSRFHNYHGDYARTVFIDEPSRRMKRVTDAICFAWSAIQEELRPGVTYAELRSFGEAALRKGGFDVQVAFNPHSVGLWHSDDPRVSEDYAAAREDIALEPGMIISVDCPVFDTGIGGTAHLEDLVLVTSDGFEAINDTAHPILVV
jgi:Xaa-Pro aminopeptidase